MWQVLRPLAMTLPAETSHSLAMHALRVYGDLRSPNPRWCQNPVQVMGIEFRNPLGLAGGFDKNAESLTGIAALGFGFVEIGTVTPRPQGGNPRPRLFREASSQSLFNRMGFNNLGSALVAKNLEKSMEKLSLAPNFRVGLSIGKNAQTPLEDTARDLVSALGPFQNKVSYVTVNLSSPNTVGIRSLQAFDSLIPILESVRGELAKWKCFRLVLKLMPEIQERELESLVARLTESKLVDAFCLTNTLAGQWKQGAGVLSGGWSGGRLAGLARASLVTARRATHLPILSVGGVLSPQDYRDRISLGADLVQAYTGFVYGGPNWPRKTQQP